MVDAAAMALVAAAVAMLLVAAILIRHPASVVMQHKLLADRLEKLDDLITALNLLNENLRRLSCGQVLAVCHGMDEQLAIMNDKIGQLACVKGNGKDLAQEEA